MSRRESLLRAVTLVLAAAFAVSSAGTPWPIFLAALIPALVQALLIVYLDRYEPSPLMLLFSGFLWGAVAAAFLAMTLNQEMGSLLTAQLGRDRAGVITPVFGGPLIEELAKGAGVAALLYLRRVALDPVLDGIVCGALVGVGFAMTENLDYLLRTAVFGGEQHLPEMMYQRALGSLNHPIFSASFGAGVGLARRRAARRLWPVFVGAFAATGQHVAWNGITARLTNSALCGATVTGICGPPTAWALFIIVPLVITLSLAPGAIALVMLYVRALHREVLVRERVT